jgi:hypothetical protein
MQNQVIHITVFIALCVAELSGVESDTALTKSGRKSMAMRLAVYNTRISKRIQNQVIPVIGVYLLVWWACVAELSGVESDTALTKSGRKSMAIRRIGHPLSGV